MDSTEDLVVEELRAAHRKIEAVRGSGECPDGLVTATVDGRGELLALDLDPRIYREHDTRALGARILAAVGEANADARRQVAAVADLIRPR
ncbi:YbaB/EbfC family nucleoid-associated protein [Amycolatopsis antarctica]|uniref:YbaB/EbfC family nucleoid-associated protein n=1 Tax=Amycolatopsis antarctica TaxID=1854586 RepID=UPI0013FE4161|nr:YbaB/EbfC family nucleoid-associated protein [Amycolatopsis antarctica]